jgi:hypothetical protein
MMTTSIGISSMAGQHAETPMEEPHLLDGDNLSPLFEENPLEQWPSSHQLPQILTLSVTGCFAIKLSRKTKSTANAMQRILKKENCLTLYLLLY